MGSWIDGVWRWGLLWRRNFFVWEEPIVQEYELEEVEEGFSVKSMYVSQDRMLLPQNNLIQLYWNTLHLKVCGRVQFDPS
jgi:hypothetical protein